MLKTKDGTQKAYAVLNDSPPTDGCLNARPIAAVLGYCQGKAGEEMLSVAAKAFYQRSEGCSSFSRPRPLRKQGFAAAAKRSGTAVQSSVELRTGGFFHCLVQIGDTSTHEADPKPLIDVVQVVDSRELTEDQGLIALELNSPAEAAQIGTTIQVPETRALFLGCQIIAGTWIQTKGLDQ